MDLDEIKYLDDTAKNRYAQLERLFDSDGWRLVTALASELAESCKERAANAQTWEDNRFAAGQRLAYVHITKLEEATETEFQAMAQSAKAKKDSDASNDDDFE